MRHFTKNRSEIIVKSWPKIHVNKKELQKQVQDYFKAGGEVKKLPFGYAENSIESTITYNYFKSNKGD